MKKLCLLMSSAALTLGYFTLNPETANAALIKLSFDNTFANNSGVTPPIVGTGTFEFDGAATPGTFNLASLTNPQFNISFISGDIFTTADIVTPLSNVSVILKKIGATFQVAFGGPGSPPNGGSLNFLNSSGALLSFEPNGFEPPLDQYIMDSDSAFFAGSYVQTVPTPALLPGLIGMGIAAFKRRKQQEA